MQNYALLRLIFTKLSENVQQLVCFITVYIQTATAQSRDVAIVTDLSRVLAKIDTSIFILSAGI